MIKKTATIDLIKVRDVVNNEVAKNRFMISWPQKFIPVDCLKKTKHDTDKSSQE